MGRFGNAIAEKVKRRRQRCESREWEVGRVNNAYLPKWGSFVRARRAFRLYYRLQSRARIPSNNAIQK